MTTNNTSIMHSTTLNHVSLTVWNEILSMKPVQFSQPMQAASHSVGVKSLSMRHAQFSQPMQAASHRQCAMKRTQPSQGR